MKEWKNTCIMKQNPSSPYFCLILRVQSEREISSKGSCCKKWKGSSIISLSSVSFVGSLRNERGISEEKEEGLEGLEGFVLWSVCCCCRISWRTRSKHISTWSGEQKRGSGSVISRIDII